MSQSRQLAAIMFTDIVGYTALMGKDEKKAFELLNRNRQIQKPIIEQYNGKWIKELGDGVMASFTTVSDAVYAAIRIQEECNAARDFQLRIGIHLGEVVFENDDVFGDGVNIASRIQVIAEPASIYISESVHQNVSNKIDINTRFVKEDTLKNVKEPVRIYKIVINTPGFTLSTADIENKKNSDKSIAVLPFSNMSSDPEQEYFSDGLTEEIITSLAFLKTLRVISRSSAMVFKGTNKNIRTIAAELNVNYILEGSVRKSGNKLRITAQLIDAHNDKHLWAERHDGDLDDIFEVQDRIAGKIVDALKIELTSNEKKHMDERPISDPKAYDLWILAMHELRKFSAKGFESGIVLANKALEIEGDNARLYCTLAYLYWAAYDFGIQYNEKTLDQIDLYVSKALQSNPSSPQALFAKGLINYKRGDIPGFIKYAKPSVEKEIDSESKCVFSFVLAEMGKSNEARILANATLLADPLMFLPYWAVAASDLFDCKPDIAFHRIYDARNKLAMGEPFAGWWVAQMAAYAGELQIAYEEFKKVASTDGGLWTDFCELFKRALENDRGGVIKQLETTKLQQFASTDEYYPLFLANALTLVGEYEAAVTWLQCSIDWGFSNHKFLEEGNRFLKPLHNHPRFQNILRKANKQQEALRF